MPNRFLPFRSGTDMNQLIAILNKNFGELDGDTITKVFSVSRTSPGFIEGQLPNNLGYGFLMYTPDNKVSIACYIDSSGQPVLKIAKAGFDALTATSDQLIFNSAQNIPKIAATGTATLPACLAAASGSSESSLVTVDTGVSTTEALAYDVYGENALGDITPFPITAATAGPTFGGYIARSYNSSGFVSGGTMRLLISVTNFMGSPISASTVRYYVYQETAAS